MQDLECPWQVARVVGGSSQQLEKRGQLGVISWEEVGRALEQRAGCRRVAARICPPTRRSEQPPGAERQLLGVLVCRPEFDAIAVSLLEVIADDLVRDVVAESGGDRAGKALVQLRSQLLRDRAVGGVADQDVHEAE